MIALGCSSNALSKQALVRTEENKYAFGSSYLWAKLTNRVLSDVKIFGSLITMKLRLTKFWFFNKSCFFERTRSPWLGSGDCFWILPWTPMMNSFSEKLNSFLQSVFRPRNAISSISILNSGSLGFSSPFFSSSVYFLF